MSFFLWWFYVTTGNGLEWWGPYSSLPACWAAQDRIVQERRYKVEQLSLCINGREQMEAL